MLEKDKGKYFFGSVKVGEKGQIVIPVEARKIFDIKPGNNLLVFGDLKTGIGICKSDSIEEFAKMVLGIKEDK